MVSASRIVRSPVVVVRVTIVADIPAGVARLVRHRGETMTMSGQAPLTLVNRNGHSFHAPERSGHAS
jgi:hypothetical protein